MVTPQAAHISGALAASRFKQSEIPLARMYPFGYCRGMYTVLRSKEFDEWLSGLRDRVAKARIAARLISVELGNFGDTEPVGEGVSELRFHFGPGYRIYYTLRGKVLVYVLGGGDKSTQKKDIPKAIALARTIED
jgi:putative addiction module killer protein